MNKKEAIPSHIVLRKEHRPALGGWEAIAVDVPPVHSSSRPDMSNLHRLVFHVHPFALNHSRYV